MLAALKDALKRPAYQLYERRLERQVHEGPVPQHLGLVLDGNRRFARASGLAVSEGHQRGADKTHEVLDWCMRLGIKTVTLWVLSTDNLKQRSAEELEQLITLLTKGVGDLTDDPRIHAHRVRVNAIGRTDLLPATLQTALATLEEKTKHYDVMSLNFAVAYGGREEILDAVCSLLRTAEAKGISAGALADAISLEDISTSLYTGSMPDPDFVIRTSGEVRMSGFLLWQAAYSEYYFCDTYWPEFRYVDFLRAIRSFQARERRRGR